MDFNKVDSNKYVISLDSLDMGLLPYTKFNNGSASLWSAKLLNTNDYFEFQVNPKTNEEFNDTNDSTISNDITDSISETTSASKSTREDTIVICHICDIQVPAAYLAEHETSLKHKAYVKIADVVLNRTRKHMLKKSNGNCHKNDNTYFCSSCTSEVKTDCKESHEKSKAHKQSVSLDRLLYELVAVYTGDHEYEESCTLNKSNNDVKMNISEVNNEVNDNTVVISDISARLGEFENKTIENKIETDEKSQKCVTIDAINHNKLNECKSTLPNGLSGGSDHSNSNTTNTKDNQFLLSITANKTKPNQTSDTSKSVTFTKLNNEMYLCTACNLQLHVNNIESHKIGFRHLNNLKSNVHYMTTRFGYKDLLCMVCTIQIADDVNKIVSHVATNDHAEKYTNMLKNNHVIQQEDNFYCKPCNIEVLKKNELTHIKTLRHETMLANFLKKAIESFTHTEKNKSNSNGDLHANDNSSNIASINSDIKPSVDSDIKPSVDSKPTGKNNFYYCDICKVNIPNNPYNISTHNDGGRHRNNAAKIISEANTVHSDIDSTDDEDEDLEIHFQMDATDNEKTLMCKVCNVVVPNIDSSVNEHITGKKHDSEFKALMDENNIEFEDEYYFCKYCDLQLKPQNLFEHIDGTTHEARITLSVVKSEIAKIKVNVDILKDLQANANEKDKADKETDDNSSNVTKDKQSIEAQYQKFKNHFVEMDDKKSLKCGICFDVEIPNDAEMVACHAEKLTHRDSYKKMMSENLIFETEDHLSYLCCICLCLVPLRGEVQHVKGLRHNDKKETLLKKPCCTACNIERSNMAEHILSSEHVKNILKSQTLLYYCEYCKHLYKKDQAMEHEKNCHKCLVKDKICFCTKCDPYLPGSSHVK